MPNILLTWGTHRQVHISHCIRQSSLSHCLLPDISTHSHLSESQKEWMSAHTLPFFCKAWHFGLEHLSPRLRCFAWKQVHFPVVLLWEQQIQSEGRRSQLEVCYSLHFHDRIPQNSFWRLNFLEKECPLHVYMSMVWGGTYMTSVLPLDVFGITGFVILLSVGPVLFYFLMQRQHKEKGTNISWPNLAGAMLFFSITTATSVENSQARPSDLSLLCLDSQS